MPFKKKVPTGEYQPEFMKGEAPEQTTESPEAKPYHGATKKGQTRQRTALLQMGDDKVVDVWERRMQNPDGASKPMIRISTPGMKIRWINLQASGRYHRARYEQGWVPVERGELVDENEIYGATFTTEGFVRRGEKQQEMLMKMPASVFAEIQKRRAELNRKSYQKLKDSMMSAGSSYVGHKVANESGDAAGERAAGMAQDVQFKGNISFGNEAVPSDEAEAGGFE